MPDSDCFGFGDTLHDRTVLCRGGACEAADRHRDDQSKRARFIECLSFSDAGWFWTRNRATAQGMLKSSSPQRELCMESPHRSNEYSSIALPGLLPKEQAKPRVRSSRICGWLSRVDLAGGFLQHHTRLGPYATAVGSGGIIATPRP